MQKGNKKIFLNKVFLYQLVNLRRVGLAETSLSILFNCDRKAVDYQFKKYLIEPIEEIYTYESILSRVIKELRLPEYKIVNGERINLGKSYKEYLKTA